MGRLRLARILASMGRPRLSLELERPRIADIADFPYVALAPDGYSLGFVDHCGNRQLLSAGHRRRDPRVALFLMDYPARRRLKIDGEAEVVERLIRIRVEAFDWNFPQFMTPRFTPAS